MNIETILSTIVAIMAGGFGIFQLLARKRVERRYLGGLKRRTGRSIKELKDVEAKSEKAINDYKHRRAARRDNSES